MRWTVFALIDAEELGVTQANVDEMIKSSTNPEVRRRLHITSPPLREGFFLGAGAAPVANVRDRVEAVVAAGISTKA